MSECKGCGSPTENCGAPIWEDVCSNKDCTYDKDQFKLRMREHGERMRKDKALRDAAPGLYEALKEVIDSHEIVNDDQLVNKIINTISKARGE